MTTRVEALLEACATRQRQSNRPAAFQRSARGLSGSPPSARACAPAVGGVECRDAKFRVAVVLVLITATLAALVHSFTRTPGIDSRADHAAAATCATPDRGARQRVQLQAETCALPAAAAAALRVAPLRRQATLYHCLSACPALLDTDSSDPESLS